MRPRAATPSCALSVPAEGADPRVRRGHRNRLNPARQALLVLVHLYKGETFAQFAAGFDVGTSTAWRYVREASGLLA